MQEIKVERADPADETTAHAILNLLLKLYGEIAIAPLNPDKLARQCYSVLCEAMTFVAWRRDRAVGTLGLIEEKFYYSDAAFLQDKWFYVEPEFRGRAGVLLLDAARKEAERRGLLLFVDDSDPAPQKKAKFANLVAWRLGYVPVSLKRQLTRRGRTHGLLLNPDDANDERPEVHRGRRQSADVQGD